jgi:hypothetical protein
VLNCSATWVDEDHDCVTDTHELFRADSKGLLAIETHCSPAPRFDEHGNQDGLKGKAWIRGKSGKRHPVTIFDVYFVAQ